MAAFLAAIFKILAAVFADVLVREASKPDTAVNADPLPEQSAAEAELRRRIEAGEIIP